MKSAEKSKDFVKKAIKKKKKKRNLRKKVKKVAIFDLEQEKDAKKLASLAFLYKYRFKNHIFPITIMRFGVQDNFLYGLKVHEVPKFRRIKRFSYNFLNILINLLNFQAILFSV